MKTRLLLSLSLLLGLFSLNAQITSVGLIGSATPLGWDNETPMTQLTDSTWTLDITLTAGECKFRADNGWAVNWGAKSFPGGIGTQDGANIPVYAGDYTVTFNSNSGAYYFDVVSDIGVIGSATPGGWGGDTEMYIDPTDTNLYYVTLDLVIGDAKFRKDMDWVINWGATDFPSGVGTQDGPNIPIPKAGTYAISFNKATGEYNFEEMVSYRSIGLIGDATPGGWDNETAMNQDPNNPDIWKLDVVLVDGGAKFRADSSWAVSWGGSDFPTGTATSDNGPNIPVVAGEYRVIFNSETGDYDFQAIPDYNVVSIIGDATPGGWDTDTDMTQDPDDKTIWRLRVDLVDGFAKFRANNDWPINWGGADFPAGIGTQDGPNIPVSAGDYKITFNTLSGEYNFEAVIEYDKISLVGRSGPFGDWPGDDDSRDFYLTKDENDVNLWSASGVELSDASAASDGGIKFRADAAWTTNWGAADFPAGVGVQNGPNILCLAGTFDVTFRSDTGDYLFSEPNSTQDLLSQDAVLITPNPASNVIKISFASEKLGGQITYRLMDMTGRKVMQGTYFTSDAMTLDISQLNAGNYLLQISNDKYVLGKKVMILK